MSNSHYPKSYPRGTAIYIYDQLLDCSGELISPEDDPYLEVKISIIGPDGTKVVNEEDMVADEYGFSYSWQSEVTSNRGEYTINIDATNSNDLTSRFRESNIILY